MRNKAIYPMNFTFIGSKTKKLLIFLGQPIFFIFGDPTSDQNKQYSVCRQLSESEQGCK